MLPPSPRFHKDTSNWLRALSNPVRSHLHFTVSAKTFFPLRSYSEGLSEPGFVGAGKRGHHAIQAMGKNVARSPGAPTKALGHLLASNSQKLVTSTGPVLAHTSGHLHGLHFSQQCLLSSSPSSCLHDPVLLPYSHLPIPPLTHRPVYTCPSEYQQF